MPPPSHITFYLVFAALLLSACAPKSNEPKPPEIAYGQDMCDACGMLVSEPKFAAATLLTNGETRKFDDVGEMFVYHMDHPEAQVRAYFVHDYKDETWLRGEIAYYALSAEIKSPMGMGVAAFQDRGDAEALAAQLGGEAKVFTFDELRVEMHKRVHG